jgi:hypothetical protein
MKEVADPCFLGDKDLSLFDWLIHNRRSLPVYQGSSWRCFECSFESADLWIMAVHIMHVHDSIRARSEESLLATEAEQEQRR